MEEVARGRLWAFDGHDKEWAACGLIWGGGQGARDRAGPVLPLPAPGSP
ncbi:MAG: hypothetical protein AVDCRST_MAG19-811 [uncultured Thermomicrobiales bacterium]|uniref:Uncharacterized protein n=1 Tax=uncultured Thermomicrobiales bacterium TaxID=1645740 RepID=A0A6J4UJV8_9BACT|nr:MAG: hypothetical protein AVDCRST_MAG19-811 [uncultured Thermomicrobiales bacterium]